MNTYFLTDLPIHGHAQGTYSLTLENKCSDVNSEFAFMAVEKWLKPCQVILKGYNCLPAFLVFA